MLVRRAGRARLDDLAVDRAAPIPPPPTPPPLPRPPPHADDTGGHGQLPPGDHAVRGGARGPAAFCAATPHPETHAPRHHRRGPQGVLRGGWPTQPLPRGVVESGRGPALPRRWWDRGGDPRCLAQPSRPGALACRACLPPAARSPGRQCTHPSPRRASLQLFIFILCQGSVKVLTTKLLGLSPGREWSTIKPSMPAGFMSMAGKDK